MMRLDMPRRVTGDLASIPLVSVVFILLIFILLVGTLAPRDGSRVEPPEAASGASDMLRPADLLLDIDGDLFLRGELAPSDAFAARVAAAAGPVTLRADRGAPSSRVLAILEALREAGVGEVELVVLRKR